MQECFNRPIFVLPIVFCIRHLAPQRYIVPCLTYCLLGIIDGQMSPDGALKTIVPIVDVAMIKQFCNLYQARLAPAHCFSDRVSALLLHHVLLFQY